MLRSREAEREAARRGELAEWSSFSPSVRSVCNRRILCDSLLPSNSRPTLLTVLLPFCTRSAIPVSPGRGDEHRGKAG